VVGALYAFTFTQGGSGNPFQLLLKRIVSFNFDEGRATPIVQKFNGDTACHIGITFFALYLYSLLKIFSKKSSVSGAYFGFFVSILGVGFFYPFLLPAVISGTLLICLFVGIQSKGACLRRPGVIVAILCVALLALFPYLSSLYSVKAEIARLRVTFSAFHLFRNAMILVITILPMLLVILLSRERLLKIVRERVVEVAIMALTIVNGLGLFLFLTAPVNCEYKFLSLAIYGIGILGGVSLWEFYDKSRVKAFLLITLFMIPTGLTFASTCFGWRVPVEPFREEGRYLIHKDNNEAQLYEWIKGNTAQNDVFIDSKPAIPVFAQRQLYIGFDQSNKYDMYLEAILGTIEGHDSKILERRRRIVENLFSATAQLDDVALSKQAGEFPEQVNVFIVARNDFFRNKFADSNMTKKVFENDKIALFGIVNCKTNSMVEK
jgi:hypothetical protein